VRIVFVVHGYPPDDLGGTEVHTAALARHLTARGNDVWIFAGRGRADLTQRSVSDEHDGDVTVRRIDVPLEDRSAFSLHDAFVRAEFERLVDDVQPDVVHVQHLARMSTDLIGVAKRRGIPVVVTLHDLWFQCAAIHARADEPYVACSSQLFCAIHHEVRPLRRYVSLLRQGALRRVLDGRASRSAVLREELGLADVIVAPSGFMRDAFLRAGASRDALRVMPHGIDVPPRAGRIDRGGPVRFGFVGSIVPAKGVHVLAEAFGRVGGDATLHLYGRRNDERYARTVDRLLGPRTFSEGEFHAKDASRVYGAIDVLVAPSLVHESFGLTVAEAQAYGIPAIVSRAGALPERVVDGVNGIVVPPGDVEALADAMRRLADRATVRALGERIDAPRTMPSYVDEIEATYAEVCTRATRRTQHARSRPNTISVAMCTYNGARFVDEQLQSIARQTRLPDELVVCDDGSSDGTVEIVRTFATTAPFDVRVIENPERLGSTKNFEQAIARCSGSLIALADQDDVWHPDKLAVQERFLESNTVAGVFSDGVVVGRDLTPMGQRVFEAIDFSRAEQARLRDGGEVSVLMGREVVAGCTLMFRAEHRDVLLPIPGDWFHDGWISIVLAARGGLGLLDEPLLDYRQHGSNQLGTPEPGVVAKAKRTLGFSSDALASDIARYESALRHVRALPQPLASVLARAFEDKIDHVRTRWLLPPGRVRRVGRIMRELRTGRYGRFSRGWRGVVKDVVRT
jgi:glycosyltransferase involved in cell wall biosynthesis